MRITESNLRRIIRSEVRRSQRLSEISITTGTSHNDLPANFIYHAVKEHMLCPAGMETFSSLVSDGGRMTSKYANCWLPAAIQSMRTANNIDEFIERHPEYSGLV